MELYRALVLLHGLFGLAALLTFWTAGFSRKGSPLHRRAGRYYVVAMLGIIASALPITAVAFARGQVNTGSFLAYLVVITATALWLGWRAVRGPREQARFRDRRYLAVALLNLLIAATVFVLGLRQGAPILWGFSLLGAYAGLQMLARRRRPLSSPRWWLREHYAAMLACGVATHIAFLSIGLNRLLQGAGITPGAWLGFVAWFAPVVVAAIVGVRLNRRHFPAAIEAARARA